MDSPSQRTDPTAQFESPEAAASSRIDAAVLLRALFLALIPVAGIVIPTEFLEGLPALCLFRLTLGVECPGCGMTRAISAVLHGELARAFAFNRGIVVVFPLLALAWVTGLRSTLLRFR